MKTRVYSLDVLKGIAAIFVIFIHERFPGTIGLAVAELGKFAVPIFFMVSGYFSHNASREKLKKAILHIALLIAVAYGLNICRIFIQQELSLQKTVSQIMLALTPKNLLLWLAFNVTTISGVAWFLFALLYSYCLHYLFYNQISRSRVFWAIPFLFGVGIIIAVVFPLIGFGSFGTNSVWFCGMPYYMCGRYLRRHQSKIMKVNIAWVISCAMLGLSIILLNVFLSLGLSYLGTIFLSVSLFALCMKYPGLRSDILERIGSTYAFCVYIFHPLIIHVFNWLLPVRDNNVLAWIRPILLVITTVAIAAAWNVIRENVKKITNTKEKA